MIPKIKDICSKCRDLSLWTCIAILLSVLLNLYFLIPWIISNFPSLVINDLLPRAICDFISLSPEFRATLLVICLTAIISLVSVLFAKYLERKTIILSHLRERKTPVYEKIVKLMADSLIAEKSGTNVGTREEVIKTIAEIERNFIVWGSDEMVLALDKFEKLNLESKNASDENKDIINEAMLNNMGELFLAIRKDLGHKNKGISSKTLIQPYTSKSRN